MAVKDERRFAHELLAAQRQEVQRNVERTMDDAACGFLIGTHVHEGDVVLGDQLLEESAVDVLIGRHEGSVLKT